MKFVCVQSTWIKLNYHWRIKPGGWIKFHIYHIRKKVALQVSRGLGKDKVKWFSSQRPMYYSKIDGVTKKINLLLLGKIPHKTRILLVDQLREEYEAQTGTD